MASTISSSPVEAVPTKAATVPASKVFISYRRDTEPDQRLANFIFDELVSRGHDVFIDNTMRTGEAWLEELDRQIKLSDYLIVLLSENSADSEMLQAEVRRAYKHRREQGHL